VIIAGIDLGVRQDSAFGLAHRAPVLAAFERSVAVSTNPDIVWRCEGVSNRLIEFSKRIAIAA
jgi:hypothetical protein